MARLRDVAVPRLYVESLSMAFRQRTYTEVPHDENLSPQMREFLASLLSQVNALAGTGAPTAGSGIAALSQNVINPTTNQILSIGGRVASIASEITAVPTATTITFFWDGSNSSHPLRIGRDDGSVFGPFVNGSGLLVTGLSASTQYFLYPYFNESNTKVIFSAALGPTPVPTNVPRPVGNPPIAFLAPSFYASQDQLLRGHIALSPNFGIAGVTTPASGTGATVHGFTGGAGTGGNLNRGVIL